MPSSNSNVEQIKDKLDIVDVISSYIKVEKAGINYKARCPFHNEKTASFFISPARQTFYCFGCGEKGDIFSFVEKFEGLDFKGALKALADRAGVELTGFQGDGRKDEKEKLYKIMEEARDIYQREIKDNKPILDYLKKRGLSELSIDKWRLGFAPEEWRHLHDELLSRGFSKEDMLEAGLIKKVPGENKYYDTFRNRIMFPINDPAGRPIAFSGRAMKEDDKTPKYLNSPETKLFYKSEVLYGFDIAKSHIRKQDYAVLVEGQLDLIMSHQAGVANTVASSGTALTELHLQRIKKLANRVIVAYDSDGAGEKAAMKAAEMALGMGMEVKVASLEKGEDPASTVKEDPEKWKSSVRNSSHLIDFALQKALKDAGNKSPVKEVLKSILPLVSKLESEIEKSQFAKKIALKLRVPEEAVIADLKKIKQSEKSYKEETGEKREAASLDRLLAGIIFLEESKSEKQGRLREKWREIIGDKIEKILDNYSKDREALIFEAEIHCAGGDTEKVSDEAIKRIELENLKHKLRETALVLDDNSISEEEEAEAKVELKKIQKRINELSR